MILICIDWKFHGTKTGRVLSQCEIPNDVPIKITFLYIPTSLILLEFKTIQIYNVDMHVLAVPANDFLGT